MANQRNKKNYSKQKGNSSKWKDEKFKDKFDGTKSSRKDVPDDKFKKFSDKLSGLNDFSWYNRNPLLIQAAANIPFPYRPGMNYNLGTYYPISSSTGRPDTTAAPESARMRIPGVMAIAFQPSIGYSADVNSPASLAAKELYGKVRESFSGSLPEDAPDILMYMIALDSIFMSIGVMKRVFRIINAYTPDNYAVPDVLLRALNVKNETQIANLRRDKMLLFQRINELIGMSRKFNCPAVMDFFNRHYWLTDNVYTDAPSINSQMYCFVPQGAYLFLDVDEEHDTPRLELQSYSVLNNDWVNSMYQYVYRQLQYLSDSEDAYTISGHLMRAYEGIPSFQVDYLEYNEVFSPVYVPEVLSQIENLQAVVGNVDNATATITQDPRTNALIHKPQSTTASQLIVPESLDPWLSVRADQPTPIDVVIASRLKSISRPTEVAGTYDVIAGSEIVTSFTIFGRAASGSTSGFESVSFTSDFIINAYGTDGVSSALVTTNIVGLCQLSTFDWSPFVRLVIYGPQQSGSSATSLFGDYHNLTTMSPEVLDNLHRVCLFSEFNSFSMT